MKEEKYSFFGKEYKSLGGSTIVFQNEGIKVLSPKSWVGLYEYNNVSKLKVEKNNERRNTYGKKSWIIRK